MFIVISWLSKSQPFFWWSSTWRILLLIKKNPDKKRIWRRKKTIVFRIVQWYCWVYTEIILDDQEMISKEAHNRAYSTKKCHPKLHLEKISMAMYTWVTKNILIFIIVVIYFFIEITILIQSYLSRIFLNSNWSNLKGSHKRLFISITKNLNSSSIIEILTSKITNTHLLKQLNYKS